MKLADIHCHVTFKPFFSDLWDISRDDRPLFSVQKYWGELQNDCEGQLTNPAAKLLAKEIVQHSQSNFERLCKSGHQLVFAALYPIEKPFIEPNYLGVVGPDDALKLLQCLQGINRYLADELEVMTDYNWLLQKEYKHFKNIDGTTSYVANTHDNYQIYFANDWQQINQNLSQPRRLGVVLTIEGVQALGPVPQNGQFADVQQLKANITHVKQTWAPPPFFITFCHHFWNGLAGHAESIVDDLEILGIYNQKHGQNESIAAQGYQIIDALLEKKPNERRILIDIKHFNARSRKDFYSYINDNYTSAGDTVPLICSHTGISSYDRLDDLIAAEETGSYKNKNKKAFLHEWSINLCAEDVEEIYKSGGVIGLQMDFKRLCGKKVAKRAYKKKHNPAKAAKRKQLAINIVIANILTIVQAAAKAIPNAANKHKAWDIVCIGSDNDGLVNALKDFQTSEELPELMDELKSYFNNPHQITNPVDNDKEVFSVEEGKNLRFGLSATTIIEKISFTNVTSFLQKYYHDGYLKA